MKSKLNLYILFGGNSSEYEVSCMSAASVLENINKDKYIIKRIGITRDGRWLEYNGDAKAIADGSWTDHPENKPASISPDTKINYDLDNGVVFPVLHGKNGEDGTVQGLLELAGIPFVGCGMRASAICMDKEFTKIILNSAEIKQAQWYSFDYRDYSDDAENILLNITELFNFPLFVKPANAGSSVGISKAGDLASLKESIEKASRHDKKILIEEAVIGRELEISVLGNREPITSCIGEIVPCNEFYDYNAKYIDEDSKRIIPAPLDSATEAKIKALAVKAYKILGCEGMSRVDFFLRQDGEIILNELNTIPGFTKISMYPDLLGHSGISYSELIDRLIELAVERGCSNG